MHLLYFFNRIHYISKYFRLFYGYFQKKIESFIEIFNKYINKGLKYTQNNSLNEKFC